MHIYVQGNQLTFAGKTYPCAIGRGGIVPASVKREGDGATPAGCWPLREVFYRADRVPDVATCLPKREILRGMRWGDAPENYNQLVIDTRFTAEERLHRGEDSVYDICVVLGYNDAPPVWQKGSAIFWHLARPGYPPTAGCVAVNLVDMQHILSHITPETHMVIVA